MNARYGDAVTILDVVKLPIVLSAFSWSETEIGQSRFRAQLSKRVAQMSKLDRNGGTVGD